jgi:CheY-like chemotaxis protein
MTKPVARADLEEALRAVGGPVKRVLVVDDSPDVLDLFSQMLRLCNAELEVVTAASGEEAMTELRRNPPDLMLLDIVMSDVDGWHVLEVMKEDAGIENVPVMFVSAQDPADQPLLSRLMLFTIGEGLSLDKLLRGSLELSKLILQPETELDPVPV